MVDPLPVALPAQLTVLNLRDGFYSPKGKTKHKRAKPGTSSDSPDSPAVVQISPRLHLLAGLHIVGVHRRPNLSQLVTLLRHVSGFSPSLAGLEPSFQLAQTRRS